MDTGQLAGCNRKALADPRVADSDRSPVEVAGDNWSQRALHIPSDLWQEDKPVQCCPAEEPFVDLLRLLATLEYRDRSLCPSPGPPEWALGRRVLRREVHRYCYFHLPALEDPLEWSRDLG